MGKPAKTFQKLIGQQVVLDASSLYVYLGTLAGEDERHLILDDVDVHDLRDTATSREQYVVEARRLGIRSNRKRVWVRRDEIVSLSALEDVIE